jgi:hypothetical protein
MERLFTQLEVDRYLAECHRYSCQEFSEELCIPLATMEGYRRQKVHFYQPYGEFSSLPPKIYGLLHGVLISHASLDRLKENSLDETALEPWHPEDGYAVLWIAGVVSEQPGVAARCIAGALDLLERSEYKMKVDMVALLSTGPQGYLMSQTLGLQDSGYRYKDEWAILECRIEPGETRHLGDNLYSVWSMTKARDVVRSGRKLWGKDWRNYSLQLANHERGQR